MTTYKLRFGVGDPTGRRSSEWVVVWTSTASDVYLATRTLGSALKASIHESGKCHVRAPNPAGWLSPGEPPRYIDTWTIDPQAIVVFPFAIVIPEPELRKAEWKQHRNKGTVWLPAEKDAGIQVAVFLVRSYADHQSSLASSGWHTTLINTKLPDGRILLVVAGNTSAHTERQSEIANIRMQANRLLSSNSAALRNPRLLLSTHDNKGTRRFVEIALNDEI